MNLAATESCDLEVLRSSTTPKGLQHPYPYAPSISSLDSNSPPPNSRHPSSSPRPSSPVSNSPPSTPPSIRVAESETSVVSDADENLPQTPSPTHSSHIYRARAHSSPGAGSSRAQRAQNSSTFHPYRPPLSLQEKCRFEKMILRHLYDSDNNSLEPMTRSSKEAFLAYIDGMSAHSFRCAVHFKEAVRECLRMEYYTTQWRVEVSNRLNRFSIALSRDAEGEFRMAEKETKWMLNMLLDREGLTTAIGDPQTLAAARDNSRKALDYVDDELAVLKHRNLKVEGTSTVQA